jgi:hypothetical protein
MKTISPSKNFPAVASAQIRHCMAVMGAEEVAVPSDQTGVSSIYSWTVLTPLKAPVPPPADAPARAVPSSESLTPILLLREKRDFCLFPDEA